VRAAADGRREVGRRVVDGLMARRRRAPASVRLFFPPAPREDSCEPSSLGGPALSSVDGSRPPRGRARQRGARSSPTVQGRLARTQPKTRAPSRASTPGRELR